MGILDANSSPQKLNKNKRLSKVPVVIIIIIAILVLFSIVYVAISRQKKAQMQQYENQPKQGQTQSKDIKSYVNELEESSKYNVSNHAKRQPITEENISKVSEEIQIKQAPLGNPEIYKATQSDEFQRELELKREMKLKALTSVSKLGIKNEQEEKKINDEQENTQNVLNSLKSLASTKNDLSSNNDEYNRDQKAEIFLSKQKNQDYLNHIKQKQFSKYEIKTGWIIQAILITGINSDLPGQILAQISQNVYDSATGNFLLIPQGTKAVGSYSSNIVYGQKRILVAWNKLIFPNGDTLNIENMQGTSTDGYSGFKDQIDNHYFRIFGSALLLSSITAGISLADNSDKHETETASDKAISAAINQMGQVASEMIRKNMNISPTLIIRPGYKFNIFVSKDIVLEPIQIGQ